MRSAGRHKGDNGNWQPIYWDFLGNLAQALRHRHFCAFHSSFDGCRSREEHEHLHLRPKRLLGQRGRPYRRSLRYDVGRSGLRLCNRAGSRPLPIVCLGETAEKRDNGLTEEALRRQFSGGPGALTPEQFSRILIQSRRRQSPGRSQPWNLIARGFGLGTSAYPGFRFLHRRWTAPTQLLSPLFNQPLPTASK